MPKLISLTDSQVKKLSKNGKHCVDSERKLYLDIKDSGHETWLIRTETSWKKVGNYETTALTALIASLKRPNPESLTGTFQEAAERYIELKNPSWKSAKSLGQWQQSLSVYAYPFIGSMTCDTIRHGNILKVAFPIWGRQSLRLAAVWCNG